MDRHASPADLAASDVEKVIVEAAAQGMMGQQNRFVPQLVDELDAGTSSLTLPYRPAIDKK